MNNYRFRIVGNDTTIDIVKEHINKYIGDSIVGNFTEYSGPDEEDNSMVVYGELQNTNSPLAKVKSNFINAFNKYGYIATVEQI
ncbi:MAG: hypothetical protein IPO62_13675 [Saprospiraceae bacterium]|nr:hypothetical protein [Saprospiraceae bacterium]MBK9632089.1 hypothetical protein [Saprospiraceae bacterium]